MSLLCKPSKFPSIWWVTSPAYVIHQNFLFWKFHQNHSPKKFPFLETISKFGKTFPKRKFPFLEFYQKSPSQKISFFGKNVSPDQKNFHQKIAFFGKSHDPLT